MSLPAPGKLPKKMTRTQKIALAAGIIGGAAFGLWLYLTQGKPTEEGISPLETTAYPYTFTPEGGGPTPEPTPTPTPAPEEQPVTPSTGTQAGAEATPTMGEMPTMPTIPTIPTMPTQPTIPETTIPPVTPPTIEQNIPSEEAPIEAPAASTLGQALATSAIVSAAPVLGLYDLLKPAIDKLGKMLRGESYITGPPTLQEAFGVSAITATAPIVGLYELLRGTVSKPLIPTVSAQVQPAWPTGYRPPAAGPTEAGYRPETVTYKVQPTTQALYGAPKVWYQQPSRVTGYQPTTQALYGAPTVWYPTVTYIPQPTYTPITGGAAIISPEAGLRIQR